MMSVPRLRVVGVEITVVFFGVAVVFTNTSCVITFVDVVDGATRGVVVLVVDVVIVAVEELEPPVEPPQPHEDDELVEVVVLGVPSAVTATYVEAAHV